MDQLTNFNQPRLLVLKDWLDTEFCEKICIEIDSLNDSQSKILNQGASLCLDEKERKTYDVHISESTRLLVQSRLIDLKSALENLFKLKLTELQKPRFLVYNSEDFSGDTNREIKIENSNCIKGSTITIIIFLKNQISHLNKDSFNEASLTFYNFFSDSHGVNYDFSVRGEAGLFTAFFSNVNYKFRPVISDDQYMIISHLTQ
jgi:hypothetical protein